MSNYREKAKLFKFSFGTVFLLLALSVLFALDTKTTFAQTCGVPGKDGLGTLNGVINTYFPAPTSSSSASGTSIPVGAVSNSESALTPIAPGDLLLIIQMQDATINTSNNSNYGAGSGTGRGFIGGTAGFYEYARATNSVSTAGGTISISSALTRTYSNDPNGTTTRGKQTYQVIRVPQYTSATISGTVSAATWDGRSGGVVVFDVAGNLAMGGGVINAAARGFRGGLGRNLNGGSGANSDYRTLATNANNASKGEGIVGTQRYVWDNLLGIDTGVEGYPLGSYAQGAPGNAGGGGTDGDPVGNSENSGGGGGGNGGNGGKGGNSWSSNLNNGGRGGAAFSATVKRITMGGGGGAGTTNNDAGATSSGARGGGIVLIRAGTISGSGTINVNGENARNSNPSCCGDGSGGGGAGGSIIVTATVPSGISGISASARGGNGGSAAVADDLHGPGGGGGGGVIMSNASYGSTNVAGGTNGTTPPTNVAYGAVSGDNGVVDTTVLPSSIDGTSSGSACLPRVTLTKVSNVDVGAFSFSGTNGFGNQSITTTVVGTGVAGSIRSLTAVETSTVITETIPSGWSLSSISCTGLGSGGNATYNLIAGTATLDSNATRAGSNIACTFTNTKVSPDLTIAKADTGNFTVGSTGTYQITVGNSGTAATSGTMTVTDTLPTGLTVANGALTLGGTNSANWSCNAASNVITCTSSTAIATSGSSVFTFNVNVGTSAPVGTNSVSNTANVSGGGEATGNNGNNGSTDTTTVLSPNLTIAKSHSPATFIRGSTGTYNISVGNSGTAATSGTVTVVDTLPTRLTVANGAVTLSGINAANWSCNAASNVITCTSTTAIATSGSSTFGFNVNVASNAQASVTNSVAVSGGNEATANNGDNSATDPTPTVAAADLTITKSHTGNFTVGSTGTYSFTINNIGSASSSGTITVSDTLPTGMTVNGGSSGGITEGGTNAANWTCTSNALSPQTVTCTSSTAIAASGNSVFNFAVSVGLGTAVGTNSVTNTANVSGGGDANTSNNSSNDPTTILSPNLTIAKADTGNFTVGSTGTYQLTVGNNGTAATSGTMTVTDTLPTGLTVTNGALTLGGTNSANWSCNAASNVITCTSSTAIATNGSSVFTFNVNVGTNAPIGTDSISNTANVSGGGEATANNGNNGSTDTTTVLSPNLTIAKSHSPATFVRGSTGTYNLSVGNSGTAATSGTVTVVDTLPTGLTIANGAVTLSGTNAANWSCNAVSNVITCTSTTAIATSGSSTFGFTVNVASNAAASVTNSVAVSGGNEATVNNGNNSATDPTPTAAEPDLTITKSHSGDFTVGSTGTYSFSVNNTGGSASSGTITVTDTLPTGMTVTNGAVTLGGTNSANWSCNAASNVITCTSSTAIAASGSSVFNFAVSVGLGTAVGTNSVTNTANVSGGGETNSSNNSSSDPTTILSPNLTIAKADTGNFTVGSTGTYQITVGNSGTAATSGTMTVTDTLPTGLTVANGALTLGGTNSANWSCNAASNVITCTSSTAIATSGSSVFTFNVNVGTNAPVGTDSVSNTANVSGGGEATANNGNNGSTDTTTVLSPDLRIAKSHTGNFTKGSTGAYTLTVSNSGTASTSGTITVTDTLPTGLSIPNGAITLGGTNSANWSCSAASNVITCTSSTAIGTSGSSVFSFNVNVSITAPDSLTNSASVSGGTEATANNTNNSANDPTNTVSNPPNVQLLKSCPSPANCTTAPQVPGTDITYKIQFTNTGGLPAANMMIVDGIPANMDYKLGTAAANVATTGLVFAIEFSSDYDPLNPTFATWAYSPASGGGGAVAGYDRNVKAIRWRVTSGTLSNVSPDNIGDISFGTRIR